ncbi:alpha-amylase family glycosyl hydrolase [Aurantibacter sp.]|uniref:alpha-amylase family glycosyl hydrolase n=1 Tax=Aurantibacter sp. TaxID=2807103 RepID=UPI003265A205
MKKLLIALAMFSFVFSCKQQKKEPVEATTVVTDSIVYPERTTPFIWDAANVYFLLTDRFYNGNASNDINYERKDSTAVLRGFMGGDITGITEKITEGYFTDLGINAIWFTPVVENIHGSVDEGTGITYGYHGYWTKDWTSLDANFGTRDELEILVETAHKYGIRILMDVVLNHTGPTTELDPLWPEEWVKTSPTCEFTNYENTTSCTLVDGLPDIRTPSKEAIKLPDHLLAKWKDEGKLSQELDELQLFFERTGYPRAPRYYIIKWLTDYIKEFGIDGYRVDTVKHVDEEAWAELYKEASYSFNTWKKRNPDKILDNNPFFMTGEVYGYTISSGREYDFGDKKVDYFNNGFKSLINFELKSDAKKSYDIVFEKYSKLLNSKLKGHSVLNYMTSHDDDSPFDKERTKPYVTANYLLLTPGASQVYYGDETARDLTIEGAIGDATLRSFMNWEDLENSEETKKILQHWQKLGKFRDNHPAIGAGRHKRLAKKPYVFGRTYIDGDYKDKVAVGLDLPVGKKSLWVKGFFGNGTKLLDTYTNTEVVVESGKVFLDNNSTIALLELAP